jgi:MYXO-CTERM domain-containing protein
VSRAGAITFVAALVVARAAAGAGTPPGGLAAGSPIETAAGCKSCHAGFPTEDGKLYMPWDTWAGSMMANAARDPLYLASLTVAEQDSPGSGAFCLRCHTPSAWVESRTTPGNGSALNDKDREGVQCAVCHRSIDASKPPLSDPMAPYIGNAQLFFDVGTRTDVTYYGPYDDSPFSPAHMTVADPFLSAADSRLCGHCHQVYNPGEHLYDASGTDTGRPFPLDTTYEEWQQSSYASGATARSCQSCHMPEQEGAYPVGSGAGNREKPRRHDFVGGNDWGPALLKAAFPGLRDAQYDYTRAAAQENLKQAARLEIRSLAAQGAPAGTVDLAIRVTNLSGHKFPTGYADGRRAWVEVAVVDAGGAVDVQSGHYDDATSELVKDDQLRLYEAVHGRDGQPQDHIVRHRQILRDSRIPPAGFRATPDTQPVGPISFSDGAGGIVAYDDATIRVALPNANGTDVTVRVRLMWQAMTHHHVAGLAAANTTDDRGTQLMQLWQQSGKAAPFVLAELTRVVHVGDGAPADAGSDGPQTGFDAATDRPIGGGGGGCGCATADTRSTSAGPMALALAAAALFAARLRRRARRG